MSASFAARVLAWYDRHGRRDLPWQHPRTAYRVWIAEVMLQQTQVATVIPYYRRFLRRFADVRALATADLDEVLRLWAGLGYYARARHLHRAAREIVTRHGGQFPRSLEAACALPGLGRSTAGAILAQAYGARHAILDGNVRRLLARYRAIPGWPGATAVNRKLWALAEALLPRRRLADYTQALMDLGATVCTARAPACVRCPLRRDCAARRANRVADVPAPRPSRVRPLRHARLLLVENARGALLFERRPPVGLWGGLWSLPMIEDGQVQAEEFLRTRYGLHARLGESLPALRHAFTHFELELQPVRLRTNGAEPRLREREALRWISISARRRPGLPRPIAALLRQLRDSPNS
ncbi:MAG: A/G-specific adenine glycosylase [Nevskia sp.]|nr:A/G-specific adenine glycosylase [Nevskia sp.]